VEEWGRAADQVFIWDYAITFNETGLPYPGEFTYEDTYRFYAANNVKGIFWEHEFSSYADLFELKFYLEAKLMDDPHADVEQLRQDFLQKYYGPAADGVEAYRRILQQAAVANRAEIYWFETVNQQF
jgi:hypothetical protein